MKILVVDDEHLVRWFLDRALKKGGHEVISASTISEASEKLDSDDFDVVFIDLRMPGGNGVELINKLSNQEKPPKIVVCSAFITSDLEAEFKKSGISVLKKPFKLNELHDILKECLGK